MPNKFSKEPLKLLFKDAWAFVSLQSTAGFTAMLNGVPSYFTDKSLSSIGNIKNIENPKINYDIFKNLAYGQWTLKKWKLERPGKISQKIYSKIILIRFKLITILNL